MSNQIAERQSTQIITTDSAQVLEIVSRAAADPNTDIDKLERLMQMHERLVLRQAETAFNNAMTEAQRTMGRVAADRINTQTKSKYATYAALDKVLRPIYTEHGFALSFDNGDSPQTEHVRVVCRVSHSGGYSKDYHTDMPADGKGAKGGDVMTKTHAAGSAISYGMRYLLKMIFNVAIGDDDDDDGNAASSANLVQDHLDYIETVRELWPTIAAVKDFLVPKWGDNETSRNIEAAREAYKELPEEDQRLLWKAPTKGGIFTTEERTLLKTGEAA